MNRRSFFGFAVGGVVAAPAAVLMGEKALDFADGRRLAVVGHRGPELVNLPTRVDIKIAVDQGGDIRAYINPSARQIRELGARRA